MVFRWALFCPDNFWNKSRVNNLLHPPLKTLKITKSIFRFQTCFAPEHLDCWGGPAPCSAYELQKGSAWNQWLKRSEMFQYRSGWNQNTYCSFFVIDNLASLKATLVWNSAHPTSDWLMGLTCRATSTSVAKKWIPFVFTSRPLSCNCTSWRAGSIVLPVERLFVWF